MITEMASMELQASYEKFQNVMALHLKNFTVQCVLPIGVVYYDERRNCYHHSIKVGLYIRTCTLVHSVRLAPIMLWSSAPEFYPLCSNYAL